MQTKAIQFLFVICGILLITSCDGASSLVADLGGKPEPTRDRDTEPTEHQLLMDDYHAMNCSSDPMCIHYEYY